MPGKPPEPMLKSDAEFLRMICHSIYHFFANGTRLTYAAIGVAVLVACLYFGAFFRNVSGFVDDLDQAAKSNEFNPFTNNVNSRWSKGKITIWILLSLGSGILAYYQLPVIFPHFFKK